VVPSGSRLTPSTPCRVENLDDLPEELDLPPDVVVGGFTRSLDTAAVKDVVSNLLQQLPGADASLRLRAFEYYIEHDAFIDASRQA
jgi:hypothetical protein